MSVQSVTRRSMDAARAPIDRRAGHGSTSTVLEGALYSEPSVAQRALTAMIADELIRLEAWPQVSVIALPDDEWAVELPHAAGSPHGLVVVAHIPGTDIDLIEWTVLPRAAEGGPERGAAPLASENLGLTPSMVHELLTLVRSSI